MSAVFWVTVIIAFTAGFVVGAVVMLLMILRAEHYIRLSW